MTGITLCLSACSQQFPTGAIEPQELYNTQGLAGGPLFDAQGLAPVSLANRPFVRVGLMWDAPGSTELEGRTATLDGGWSDWQTIRPRWSEGLFHTAHLDLPAGLGLGQAFQLRLSDGQAPSFLIAEAIEQVGAGRIENTKADPGYDQISQALAPHSLVRTRADWGARSPACNSGSHSPAKVTIHHTATPLPDSVSVITRLRGIQNYHIDSNGWCDIGYHYLVDWNGELWQGRYETTLGAHVANNNTNNVGISFMGTYNSSSPSSAQINKVASLVDWLHNTYGIPKTRTYLKGHREYRGNSAGDCPGDRIQARLSDLLNGGSSQPSNGSLKGSIFVDQGSGTADMSQRLEGATVTVAGGASTTASGSDALWSIDLPAGTYTVTASKSGYLSASRSCTVSAGQDTWCSIGLSPNTPSGEGRLIGSAYVDRGDGDMSQRLPGTLVQAGGKQARARDGDGIWEISLPAGTYTAEASLNGYHSASRSCTVSAGQDSWCSIGLRVDEPTDPVDPEDPEDPTDPVDPGDPSDPADPRGLIYGTVIAQADADAAQACQGTALEDALVEVDGQSSHTDGQGYFEFWVAPGAHLVSAAAEGHLPAQNTCSVEEDGSTFCCLALRPAGDPDDPSEDPDPPADPQLPGEEPDLVIHGGCASAGASGAGSWLGLGWLLGLMAHWRRRERRA